MNRTGKILVVADEPVSLASLQELFGQAGSARDVEYFSAAAEALSAVAERDFRVIFVQLAQGSKAGMDFLQEIWKISPHSIRFFVGQTLNPEMLVQCVVNAHHYLQSPLGLPDLKAALERAECVHRLVRNQHLQSLVSRMRTLPSRPSLYLEVLRELRSPSASAQVVGELVEKDLGISTKLIQVVNSAFYGLSQKVEDPASAVLLLGLETTASLVLSIEAFSRFDQVKPLYFSTDRVWRHSQAVAHSARKIAELMSNDVELARHAFTAGLVHDIGKLALALNFEEQYQGALKLAEKNKLSPCEVEAEVFGATHAETGAYLLSLWGLPLPIVEAVAAHHQPAASIAGEFTAATALHLAERLHSEHDQIKEGVAEPRVDLAYPESLEVLPRLDEFRRIVGGREGIEESGTMIMTRAQLKSVPMPVNVAARPAPLEVRDAKNPPKSRYERPMIFATAVAVGLLGIAAFAVLRAPKHEEPYLAAREEKAVPGPAPLSKLVADEPKPVPAANTQEPAPEPEIRLQAIMFNGARSSMVINGRSFRLGDEVAGGRIVAVQPNEVTIEKNGTQRKLTLH